MFSDAMAEGAKRLHVSRPAVSGTGWKQCEEWVEGCLGSCAMMRVLSVMALLLRSERFSGILRIVCVSLFLLGEVNMVKKRGGTVEENGLNYTFVEQQQKVGGQQKVL